MKAPENFIVPTYTTIADFSGGINLSAPEDQIGDTQSPDMQNLIYINGVLQVDTGYVEYGSVVAGTPLQVIQFELTSGTFISCLVTSSAFYTWDSGVLDWQVMMTPVLSTTLTAVADATVWASSFSSAFGPSPATALVLQVASVAGLAVGDVIQLTLSDGTFFNSTIASISGDNVTCTTDLLPGQDAASGAVCKFFAPLHGGQFPISWTVDPTTNTLIWTNGVDAVQAFNGSTLAPLAGLSGIASTCRIVTRYFGFTLAIGPTEGGSYYPYRVRRSSDVSSTDWTSYGITGYDDLVDTSDAIVGASIVGTYLILARENSVMSGSYWGTTDAIFFWQYMITGTGALGGVGLIKGREIDYLISQSGVFQYTGGYTLASVGDNIFNFILGPEGNLNPETNIHLFGIYVAEIDEIWFFYPSTRATYCDTLLRYSQKYKSWFPVAFPLQISGAGFAYRTSALTWAQSAGEDWLQDTLSWNSRAAAGNFPILLMTSTLDSRVYAYDFQASTWSGVPIPWYFVSKDFPVMDQKLLFDGIVAYGVGNGVLCELSTDSGITWETIGTFNFGLNSYSKQVLDYQITGDFFRFRLSGVGYGFFLSQISLRYLDASEF